MKAYFLIAMAAFAMACSPGERLSINTKKGNGNNPASTKPVVNPKPGRGNVVAMGDNYVLQNGASSLEESFIGQVSKWLKKDIYVTAKKKATTRNLLNKQLDKYLSVEDAKLVIISAGLNDYLKNRKQDVVAEDLVKVIKDIQKQGTLVSYIAIRPTVFEEKEADEFFLFLERAAEDAGALVIKNPMKGMWGKDFYMDSEFFPNDTGHDSLFRKVKKELRKVY